MVVNFKIATMYGMVESVDRKTIMGISINSRTSGFRKWSQALQQNFGDAGNNARVGETVAADNVDHMAGPAARLAHRPWLVPGIGKL